MQGTIRGRYELLTPIAAGGMASVWAAQFRGAQGFARVVALKCMLPELALDTEYRTMFLDEARIASKLRHPNICATLELGEENGELFMALEWVDGVSLHRLLRGGRIAPRLAAKIIAAACAGLHAAHEAADDDGAPLALVHRDVSPQNLLVGIDGHVKVSDFGIAKARGCRHETAAGQAKGKLAYMAPEQLRGTGIDRRADVFALGSVLYEATTGQKPFTGETDGDVMKAILRASPRAPSELLPEYPRELERILARAMAFDPDDRFASAEGLRLALEHWLHADPTSVRDVATLVEERAGAELDALRERIRTLSSREPTAVPDRLSRLVAALGGAVAVAAAMFALWPHAAPTSASDPAASSLVSAVSSSESVAIAVPAFTVPADHAGEGEPGEHGEQALAGASDTVSDDQTPPLQLTR